MEKGKHQGTEGSLADFASWRFKALHWQYPDTIFPNVGTLVPGSGHFFGFVGFVGFVGFAVPLHIPIRAVQSVVKNSSEFADPPSSMRPGPAPDGVRLPESARERQGTPTERGGAEY